jgi:hypothetical protein
MLQYSYKKFQLKLNVKIWYIWSRNRNRMDSFMKRMVMTMMMMMMMMMMVIMAEWSRKGKPMKIRKTHIDDKRDINIDGLYSWGKNSLPLSFLHGFVVSHNNNSRVNIRHFVCFLLVFTEGRRGTVVLSPIKKGNNTGNLQTILKSWYNYFQVSIIKK